MKKYLLALAAVLTISLGAYAQSPTKAEPTKKEASCDAKKGKGCACHTEGAKACTCAKEGKACTCAQEAAKAQNASCKKGGQCSKDGQKCDKQNGQKCCKEGQKCDKK